MRQIVYTEATGKVLANIWYEGRDMVLLFTDDTWVHCHINSGYERGDEEYEFVPFGELEPYPMLEAGILNQVEYDAIIEQECLDRESYLQTERRKQYEKLKAEFGA